MKGIPHPRARGALAAACWAVLFGCGGSEPSAGPEVAEIVVTPHVALLVGVGDTVTIAATPLDSSGRSVQTDLGWRSSDPSVLTVDAGGRATAVGAGAAKVTASAGGVSGAADVEVYVPSDVTVYEPGTQYFGRGGYVEYVPGTLPLVISAPHGGDLSPDEIPDRSYGTLVTDSNTRETLVAVREALIERTGHAPHIVISHLRRTKLDPNREIVEAAQGNPFAENAWEEFQGFIERAKDAAGEQFGTGLYLDLHGHGHPVSRVELGYLLSAQDLARPDEELDLPTFAEQSSVRALFHESQARFSQVLRGPESLGGLLEAAGVRSVPSPGDPSPGDEPYFTGGYNTARHGSRDEGVGVSGIQLELHLAGVRDTEANRARFGAQLAAAVETFMTVHYGFFRPD